MCYCLDANRTAACNRMKDGRTLELDNRTAFPACAFRQFDRVGGIDAVVSVRGTFDVMPGGPLHVAASQEPFQWEDSTEGDADAVSLMRQADTVPFKPGTDVTVLAQACCPDPAGAPVWTCGLHVAGAQGVLLDKRLQVTGPRWWRPRLRPQLRSLLGMSGAPVLAGWELTPPEPVRTVDLGWRLARFGAANPAGRGTPPDAGGGPVDGSPLPAHQIEGVDDPELPAGLGPVAPWWEARMQHAGTGGLVWLDEHRPVLPADFDERFWQCAPPDQVVIPYLRGTERYMLSNLHAEHPTLAGVLPGIMLGVTVDRPDAPTERLSLELDGMHFDLRPGWDRVVLTWRRRFPMPGFVGVRLTLGERARIAAVPAREGVAA